MSEHFSLPSFIAGLVVGALLVGAWFLGVNSMIVSVTSPEGTSSTTASSATNQASTSGAISVSDQPAGSTVLIASLTVPPPGVWVAVRELSAGELGNVLGAVRVGGPRSNVSIPLLRATEAGHQYAVELYRDDNNGVFDPAVNSVYVDFGTGARVVVYFKTTD